MIKGARNVSKNVLIILFHTFTINEAWSSKMQNK